MPRMPACILCLAVVLAFSACTGNSFHSSVPTVPVYMDINILTEDPHFVTSNTGAYKEYTQKRYETDFIGYRGLLVYVGMDARYHAFDLACPHCLNRVGMQDMMYAVCPSCGEQYEMTYGYATPARGISREALRRYSTSFDGTILRIRN